MPKRPWTTPILRGPFPLVKPRKPWTKPVMEVRNIHETESGNPDPHPDGAESLS